MVSLLIRYFLVFSILLVSFLALTKMYVVFYQNELTSADLSIRPSNTRVKTQARSTNLGTAKSKSNSSISSKKTLGKRTEMTTMSYSEYKRQSRK